MLALLLGMAAAAAQIYFHYHNRDESADLTTDDLKAAYHGLNAPAPLVRALERGHPPQLDTPSRDLLLKWLRSGRIVEDFDSIDLGPASPADLIATNCLACHSAAAAPAKGAAVRLDSPEAIRRLAFSKVVNRTPADKVAVSTHTHALSLATLSLALAALLWLTRYPRTFVSWIVGLTGLALFADLAAWWLSRSAENLVYLIIGAGAAYNGATVLTIVLILIDLWLPRRSAPASSDLR
jgi:hypothetical protein